MTLFLLLPAYNEAENIPELFRKIQTFVRTGATACKVVLVDDGSSDDTFGAAQKSGQGLDLVLERHLQNQGLAETLRTGFKEILSMAQPDDVVAVMDADNSHDPQLLVPMLDRMIKTGNGVIASRYQPGSRETGLSSRRKILSYVCNFLLGALYPMKGVSDYTSGYRLFKVLHLEKLAKQTSERFFDAQGFVCASELLINLGRVGAEFSEVPLILRYDLKKGQSKMRATRTILDYLNLFRKGN